MRERETKATGYIVENIRRALPRLFCRYFHDPTAIVPNICTRDGREENSSTNHFTKESTPEGRNWGRSLVSLTQMWTSPEGGVFQPVENDISDG